MEVDTTHLTIMVRSFHFKIGDIVVANENLFVLGKPCFYTIETDESAFQDFSFQLGLKNTSHVIRIVRGKKSRTTQDFFDEISSALQFPYYFGENWDAFDECITDLDWIEGTAYLLMISNARLLLSDADDENFRILLRTLEEANEAWLHPNQTIPRNLQPTPFHVLFQCTASDIAAFSERLAKAHVRSEPFDSKD